MGVEVQMDKVIEMLKKRQGDRSLNAFAKELGIWPSTLSRYYAGQREMSKTTVEKLARYFLNCGDFDAIATLHSYALGGMYGE